MKKILTLFLLLTTLSAYTQVDFTIGAIKSPLGNTAINLGISYAKSLDSIWQNQDLLIAGKHSFFLITPSFKVETGTADALSSINAKVVGLFVCFKDTTISGLITPNLFKTFHTYPISFGVESNNQFSVFNGILEAGWVPWFQKGVLQTVDFGLFLQAGYKWKGSTPTIIVGGAKDESAEPVNNAILRLKGSMRINTDAFITINGFRLGLVGMADGWYDILNSKVYHKIDGRARIFLDGSGGRYFDFVYLHGLGAPNFNKGDEYGVALTVTF